MPDFTVSTKSAQIQFGKVLILNLPCEYGQTAHKDCTDNLPRCLSKNQELEMVRFNVLGHNKTDSNKTALFWVWS